MNQNSALQWMEIQASALFVDDAEGRLHYIREPGYTESELDPAPRFFMGRTMEGNIWRFRHDLPDALVSDLDRICRAEPATVNLWDPPQIAALIRAALEAHAPVTEEERGPAYWIPPGSQAGQARVVRVSEANTQLLESHFHRKVTSRGGYRIGPLVAAVDQGKAVSICYCARITPQAAEAGVETVEAYRGQGYASAAVAGWATVVRQHGLAPLYSTSWENAASQGVARKLGMICYGEDWTIF